MRYARTAAGGILTGELPAGAVAYVDADWLPPDGGAVPALVARADGSLLWGDAEGERLAPGDDAKRHAASSFLQLARDASRAVPVSARGVCDVPGSGLVAEWVRQLLGGRAAAEDEAPVAIVETRGDAASTAASSSRLADLGTLVLAGEGEAATLALDLYADVHVRGLRVVGVALLSPDPTEKCDGDESFLGAFPRLVTDVRLGEPLPDGARCYRVSP